MVPYVVGAVVAVTVMHVLLFVLHVCMLREYEGDGNDGVGSGGCVVAVSAYMGGTRGSGVLLPFFIGRLAPLFQTIQKSLNVKKNIICI